MRSPGCRLADKSVKERVIAGAHATDKAVMKLVADIYYLIRQHTGYRDILARLNRDPLFWGVKLVPPRFGICCKAILLLEKQVFRKTRVPRLPLKGCVVPHCRCYYKLLPERRSGKDRRQSNSLPWGQSERRFGKDRRSHKQLHPVD